VLDEFYNNHNSNQLNLYYTAHSTAVVVCFSNNKHNNNDSNKSGTGKLTKKLRSYIML